MLWHMGIIRQGCGICPFSITCLAHVLIWERGTIIFISVKAQSKMCWAHQYPKWKYFKRFLYPFSLCYVGRYLPLVSAD